MIVDTVESSRPGPTEPYSVARYTALRLRVRSATHKVIAVNSPRAAIRSPTRIGASGARRTAAGRRAGYGVEREAARGPDLRQPGEPLRDGVGPGLVALAAAPRRTPGSARSAAAARARSRRRDAPGQRVLDRRPGAPDLQRIVADDPAGQPVIGRVDLRAVGVPGVGRGRSPTAAPAPGRRVAGPRRWPPAATRPASAPRPGCRRLPRRPPAAAPPAPPRRPPPASATGRRAARSAHPVPSDNRRASGASQRCPSRSRPAGG